MLQLVIYIKTFLKWKNTPASNINKNKEGLLARIVAQLVPTSSHNHIKITRLYNNHHLNDLKSMQKSYN